MIIALHIALFPLALAPSFASAIQGATLCVTAQFDRDRIEVDANADYVCRDANMTFPPELAGLRRKLVTYFDDAHTKILLQYAGEAKQILFEIHLVPAQTKDHLKQLLQVTEETSAENRSDKHFRVLERETGKITRGEVQYDFVKFSYSFVSDVDPDSPVEMRVDIYHILIGPKIVSLYLERGLQDAAASQKAALFVEAFPFASKADVKK